MERLKQRPKLIEARLKMRLTQGELAEQLGTSRDAILMWENGKTSPHPYSVRALCTFFGIDIKHADALLEIRETPYRGTGRSKLRAAREERDLTQAALADLAGVRLSTISEWETGAITPSVHSRKLIRRVLDNQDPDLFALDREEPHKEEPHKEETRSPAPTEATHIESTSVREVHIERVIPQMNTISLLQQERLNRHWSRARVEALTEGRILAVSLERWEARKAYPRDDNILELCKLYNKSAKELGLDRSNDIMGTGNNNAPTTQEEPPMSELVRRAIFSNLGSKLTSLIDTWPKRDYAYTELQEGIYRAILDYNTIVAQEPKLEFRRREALKSMILVPLELVGGVTIIEAGKRQKTDTDILLKHCAAGIAACWYLRRGKELLFVSGLVSEYIKMLHPLILSQSESYRKAAATLLAQSFMLKSHLGDEGNTALVEQAIYCSDLSEDSTTQVLAYRRRANEHWESKNYKYALLDAEKGYGLARSNKAIPKIIHSVTAASLSLCQAACGKTDDAKISIAEAYNLFDPTMPVPSMSYGEAILTYVEARVKQHSGNYQESTDLYKKSLLIPDISALGAIQNRINYAKNEVSRDDRPRKMDLCIKLLTESVSGAKELNSSRFQREAREVYDLLRIVWPREDAVKQLGRDHFGMK